MDNNGGCANPSSGIVEQLRAKLTEKERDREILQEQLTGTVQKHERQIGRLRSWCDRWVRGDYGSMEVVSAIAAELRSNLALEPTELDRRRSLQRAQDLALLNKAMSELQRIVEILGAEGIELVETPVEMVEAYIEHAKNQINAAQSN